MHCENHQVFNYLADENYRHHHLEPEYTYRFYLLSIKSTLGQWYNWKRPWRPTVRWT